MNDNLSFFVDSTLGCEPKEFSSNNAVLLDFVRQIFQNRENERLSLDEIKRCLENGEYIDIYAKYKMNEKNWKNILKKTINLLIEMGYGIYDEYIYSKNSSRFTNLNLYSDIPNNLYKHRDMSFINQAIEKEKCIDILVMSQGVKEIKLFPSKIVKMSLNPITRKWSKDLFKKIDMIQHFPFLATHKSFCKDIEEMISSFDGQKINSNHLYEIDKIIDDNADDVVYGDSGFITLTPYIIIDNKLIGGRLTKDTSKLYPIECIPIENIYAFSSRLDVLDKKDVRNLPFDKIKSRFASLYGQTLATMSKQEILQKIYHDKLWEYVKYHVIYKFIDDRSVKDEIQQKFKLINEIKNAKGYYSCNFTHNNKKEVFEFVQNNQSGLMKFTTDDIQNEYSQWVKNNRNKKRIDD